MLILISFRNHFAIIFIKILVSLFGINNFEQQLNVFSSKIQYSIIDYFLY